MSQTTVRVSGMTHATLKELARIEKEPMQGILGKAVEAYRRRQFLQHVNEMYASVLNDPQAKETLLKEMQAWDQTLGDGLGQDECWNEAHHVSFRKEKRGR